MIEISHYPFFDNAFQGAEVYYISSIWINIAFNGHFQLVIVAVVVRVAARSENAMVLLIAPLRIVDSVRGIEFQAFGYAYFRHQR